MVVNYHYDVWVMKRESIKKEFLSYAINKMIWCNYERFQYGDPEYADVESFIKHNPNVLDDWLCEQGSSYIAKNCLNCNMQFIDTSTRKNAKYCAPKCKMNHYRTKKNKE